mgnify:FL=1|tara:strand:- start:29 stop:631 length:603 start_codon:yes stop_codon:yes gene_type:complete
MSDLNKYLIREFYELCDGGQCQDFLTEAEKRKVREGTCILSGKLQEAECLNGNKRIYPEKILRREIQNYKKFIDDRRAMGELDHPDSSVVNLQNVSHLVTDVWWDGKKVMGKIEVLDTPSGRILKSLVEAGIKMGISSRALGSVTQRNGKTYVEDDLQLICFDMVSEPSTPDAFMLKEHKKLITRGKVSDIHSLLDSILK